MAMFSIHMIEHMVFNMFVPVLLVLGAGDAGVAGGAAGRRGRPPGPREWILWLVHRG